MSLFRHVHDNCILGQIVILNTAVSTATPASSSNLFASTTPATSAPGSLFGAPPATTGSLFGAPAASNTSSPFGSFGATPASSAAAISAPTTATAPATSLYPSLSITTPLSAATSTAAAPSLFTTAPATTLPGGSLFGAASSTAATNALSNAAGKGILGASTAASTASVALTPDTIAGSTKYTELPADAKNTLDQFHKFLQDQIHLSATLTARPSESLDRISKDREELSERLEMLQDSLDRDIKVIEALQDKVGQELKQADSAGRIIEAYANTSQAHFLYAGNNSAGQYFMDQCQSFEEQLRQFRSTIEEIERHLASFEVKQPHASHALPEVMRAQHNGFLVVTGKVAALHEDIMDKKKAYLMFQRKYLNDDTDPFQASVKHRKVDGLGPRAVEGSKSFREIAKVNLRASSNAAPLTAAAPATAIAGSQNPFGISQPASTSLFSAPAASTNAPFSFKIGGR
ncbi:Nucleoporin p58/p45 [Dissophora globulifera]|uniref:Nucleoporin p58/p45 n=1 Tax=Dissophora globulifera TaxID=979702 RepID=A0A9P6QZ26_9FUNG|nr:Nucleoporin p58/p45 [Dissophora globulifera]